MTDRFADLEKIPNQPAARFLAMANAKLKTKLDAPASAGVSEVLAELEAKKARIDMIRLLSTALPARERVWWSCLAARDLIGPDTDPTPPLAAAEAWVFKPNDENRLRAKQALDLADIDDETVHCARAVLFFDGTLGPGELAEHEAPPGVSEISAYAMNVTAMSEHDGELIQYMTLLIDRGLDIARGGNGKRAANDAGRGGA